MIYFYLFSTLHYKTKQNKTKGRIASYLGDHTARHHWKVDIKSYNTGEPQIKEQL